MQTTKEVRPEETCEDCYWFQNHAKGCSVDNCIMMGRSGAHMVEVHGMEV